MVEMVEMEEDVIFVADPNINTLIDFKYKKVFTAENGENGQKKQMYGKTGADLDN